MNASDPTAFVPVSSGIPWAFPPAIIAFAAIVAIVIVRGIASYFAYRLTQKTKQEGTHYPTPFRTRGTLAACIAAALAGTLVGVNFEGIWYRMNPDLPSAEENEQSVIDQFSEQGVTAIELRETTPQHPIQVLNEGAWDGGFPQMFMYSCDASEINDYGQYPAYDGWEWTIPVTFTDRESGKTVDAELDRMVRNDECHYQIRTV